MGSMDFLSPTGVNGGGGHIHSLTPMSLSDMEGNDAGAVVDTQFTFSSAVSALNGQSASNNSNNSNTSSKRVSGKSRHSLQVSAEIEYYSSPDEDENSEIIMNG